jgi:hypothetical protein
LRGLSDGARLLVDLRAGIEAIEELRRYGGWKELDEEARIACPNEAGNKREIRSGVLISEKNTVS